MNIYAIIGAGGFAREVMPLARDMVGRSAGSAVETEFIFVIEDGPQRPPERLNGHRVLQMREFIAMRADARYFAIAIANSAIRERVANSIPADVAQPFSIIARTCVSLDDNEVGDGAIFCNFSHVMPNARVGKHFHCNIYSHVSHDVVIGDFVTFAPRVSCNGNVVVEDHAYLGTGAIIRDGTPGNPVVIGRGAVVGMGAVVTGSVPPGVTVTGIPAKPLARVQG